MFNSTTEETKIPKIATEFSVSTRRRRIRIEDSHRARQRQLPNLMC